MSEATEPVVEKNDAEGEEDGGDEAKEAPAPKKQRHAPALKREVICYSRRTDACGELQLDELIKGLRTRTIVYHHPHFALNPHNDRFCATDLDPSRVLLIDIWSKNYARFIARLPELEPLLRPYKLHLSFTINGGGPSPHEPGLRADIPELLKQLGALVAFLRDRGQNPLSSLLIHVDPISVYEIGASSEPHYTTEHLAALFPKMRELGLDRVHLSFTQFCWRGARSRLSKLSRDLRIRELTAAEQLRVFDERVLPLADGIRFQTCTATSLLSKYSGSGTVVRGACCGYDDVLAIVGDVSKVGPRKTRAAGHSGAIRNCTCFPFKDIGCARQPCENGCRYCFMNPRLYAW